MSSIGSDSDEDETSNGSDTTETPDVVPASYALLRHCLTVRVKRMYAPRLLNGRQHGGYNSLPNEMVEMIVKLID